MEQAIIASVISMAIMGIVGLLCVTYIIVHTK